MKMTSKADSIIKLNHWQRRYRKEMLLAGQAYNLALAYRAMAKSKFNIRLIDLA
jgi:hypothetical protein